MTVPPSFVPRSLAPLPSLGQLSRPMARLCLQVSSFIEGHCQLPLHGQSLLVALSGGADSTALLTILALLRPHKGHCVRVLHVDHGLRPESPAEAQSVAALCAAWSIPCHLVTAPVAEYAAGQRSGLEEAGRHLRYQLLEAERQKCGAGWCVTGHHRDDLAEDMLMRLVRGTGWPGLAGMTAVDAGRHLLRPLLLCDPQELRKLLREYGLGWHEDPSNADITYSRNRMRHSILPLLRAENPSLHQGLENLWTLAHADTQHWEHTLEQALVRHNVRLCGPQVSLPRALLRDMDRATRLRLYMRAIKILGQGQARAETLFKLDESWSAGRGGTLFQLPGGIEARLLSGNITFMLHPQDNT